MRVMWLYWRDRQTGRQADELSHRQTQIGAHRQTSRQATCSPDRQTDRQSDNQTDSQTIRQTGRQADRYASCHAVLVMQSVSACKAVDLGDQLSGALDAEHIAHKAC